MSRTNAFGAGDTQLSGTRPESSEPTASSSSQGLSPVQLQVPVGLVGQHLRHFRIDRLIAEGGMGQVYQGYDMSLERPVAIKVIRPDVARDRRFLQIFLREAQAQANVVHPHVLQAYYVGEERGVWFLAMQLVEGGSLEDRLARGECLTWKEAAHHMLAVTEGLVESARLGIVHRDIKPANILLDRNGEAHLADFGLATSTGLLSNLGGPALGPNTRKPGTTQPGAIMGTPEYMPPEQLTAKAVDQRTDIYALGATFYQLLAGRLPYPITDLPSAQAALRGAPAPRLATLCPEVPRAFCALIDRCISRDPEARPDSHAVLVTQLRKIGPQPELSPSPLTRALSLLIDLIPFGVVLPWTYVRAPGLAYAVLALWLVVGMSTLASTPGQWLMRLTLRGLSGGDVPLWRATLRSFLQLGWLLPASLFLSLTYVDSAASTPLGVLAVLWAAVFLLGTFSALGRGRQTLADRLTHTRVLVATE